MMDNSELANLRCRCKSGESMRARIDGLMTAFNRCGKVYLKSLVIHLDGKLEVAEGQFHERETLSMENAPGDMGSRLRQAIVKELEAMRDEALAEFKAL